MDIEITKKQETINDVPSNPDYSITATQHYGSGEFHRTHHQTLYSLSLDDVLALRDRLNKDFPTN